MKLFGFWRFVFCKSFRRNYIDKFKQLGFSHKCMEIIGAMVATSVGIGVPVLAIYFLFIDGEVNSTIDSCLDSGGSYNYLECECDYTVNHPYIAEHQCK